MGSLILYSFKNDDNSYFHITNGTFIDIDQDLSSPESVAVFSGVFLITNAVDLLFKKYFFFY